MNNLHQFLINHNELCALIYKGNLKGALDFYQAHIPKLKSLPLHQIKLYLDSLNTSIYHFVLWKENTSLHNCCIENNELIRSCTPSSFQEIGELILKNYSSCTEYHIEKLENTHMKCAIRYIHEQLNSPLTLQSVSKEINLTPCYLCDLFRQTMDTTFSEYVRCQRIKLAKQLLQITSLSISEIAIQCGFQTSSYFCSCFKKAEGIAPLNYKKRMQQLS